MRHSILHCSDQRLVQPQWMSDEKVEDDIQVLLGRTHSSDMLLLIWNNINYLMGLIF